MSVIAIYGAGQLGHGVAQILSERGDHVVRGPMNRHERIHALSGGADLVLIATTTRLRDVIDDIQLAVASGSNVLVSAEESANPWLINYELAKAVHHEALAADVTILGAGLNPGLIFDAMVLTILGASPDDVEVTVYRTVDISGFGPTVLSRIGVGISPEKFFAGVAAGDILGHAGFPQSMSIVGRALGRDFSTIDAHLQPLVTDHAITFADGRTIPAGLTVGVDQTYQAVDQGHPWYTAQFIGHVAPADAGLTLSDVITVHRGDDVIQQVRATPCFPSQSGSQHVLANSVDRVIAAAPGWLTVADLPPATRNRAG